MAISLYVYIYIIFMNKFQSHKHDVMYVHYTVYTYRKQACIKKNTNHCNE